MPYIAAIKYDDGSIIEVDFNNGQAGSDYTGDFTFGRWSITEYETPPSDEDIVLEEDFPNRIELIKTIKKRALAKIRWEHETGGFSVNGFSVATTRETQSMLHVAWKATPDGFTTYWKGENGWMQVTKEMIGIFAQIMTQYVQNCFQHEKELSDLIDNGENVDLNSGWPTQTYTYP